MNTVEFLIQKEGDRAWLPLESPTVEVLEGRYHLVANANHGHTPVQIQIRHRYTQDGVLQEELEQKLLQPDEQGQLQILSSVYLGYGLWTISCTPIQNEGEQVLDPADIPRFAISLQVLEEDFELISDWEFTEVTPLLLDEPMRQLLDPLSTPVEVLTVSASSRAVARQNTPNSVNVSVDADNEEANDGDVAQVLEASTVGGLVAGLPADVTEAAVEDTDEVGGNETDADAEDGGETADVLMAAVTTTEAISSTDAEGAALVSDMPEASALEATSAWTMATEPQLILPALPQVAAQVKAKMELRPIQGWKLPPELGEAAVVADGGPQLPMFSRTLRWRYIPLERLSAAGRSHPGRQRQESDRAFAALQLQQRFRQTLTHLATDERSVPVAVEPSLDTSS